MADLKDVRDFISRSGVAAVRHELYTRQGLRRYPPEQDATEPVVDFIAKGDVFAWIGTSSQRTHAVWIDKVVRKDGGEEYELRAAPDEEGDLLVLRVQLPTPKDRGFGQEWLDYRDPEVVGAELKALHADLSDVPPERPKFGPRRKYRVVLAHAGRQGTRDLHTAAAIAAGHGEIAAAAYPGTESVADRWNERFALALENGGRPGEILDHWLERVNGVTEELSPPFLVEGTDAIDAARRALVDTNTRTDMTINV